MAARTDPLLEIAPPDAVGGPGHQVFPEVGPELFEALRRGGHRKLSLQVPAGLLRNAHDLAAQFRAETGLPVALVARACFGACDFPSAEEASGADASVVLGHAPIPNVRLPMATYFVEMRSLGGDPERLAGIVDAAGLPRRLGVVASIQHLDLLPRLIRALEATGREIRTAPGDRRLQYAAQALGCNYTTAEAVAPDVEAFVFLGTGRFHPLGLAFAVDRPVWSLDPLQGTLEAPIDRARLIARRQLVVAGVRDALHWGILVSTFAGQNRGGMAAALQARAHARGRTAEILVFGRLDPSDLTGRALDAYVNTACPRIALDDGELYSRPMLTPPEFLMALGELPLEPYRFDTFH
jgi:2-(3-amino-3-carboxypropyl)histidine synthase